MALTRYKVLRRSNGIITEISVEETHGPKQAMRRVMERGVPLGDNATLIATPEGNWTEFVPVTKTITTISFLDSDGQAVNPDTEDEA